MKKFTFASKERNVYGIDFWIRREVAIAHKKRKREEDTRT